MASQPALSGPPFSASFGYVLVRRIAHRIYRQSLSGRVCDLDDLVQDGMLGFLKARRGYAPDRGIPFEAYASRWIYGAILDGQAALASGKRSARSRIRRLNSAEEQLEQSLGRSIRRRELAEFLGVNASELGRRLQERDRYVPRPESLEGGQFTVGGLPIEEWIDSQAVVSALRELKPKQAAVLYLYYLCELDMAEVALVMSLSVARISQLHDRALAHLRRAWTVPKY